MLFDIELYRFLYSNDLSSMHIIQKLVSYMVLNHIEEINYKELNQFYIERSSKNRNTAPG